jgi:hypothetical protein
MKFGKNREVDSLYLNVPVKYILNYTGANEGGKNKYDYPSYEEWVRETKDWLERNPSFKEYFDLSEETYEELKKGGDIEEKLVKKGKDKTLCIISIRF